MRADQNQAVLRHEVKASERWQFETDVYRTRFHRNWYKLDGYLDSTETRISLSKLYATAQTNRLQEDTPNGEALLLKANNRWYGTQGIQHRGTVKFGSALSNQVVYGVRLHEDWVDRFQWRDAYRLNSGNMGLVEEGTPGVQATASMALVRLRASFGPPCASTIGHSPWHSHRADGILPPIVASDDPDRTGTPEERSNAVAVWLPGIGVTYELPNADHAFLGSTADSFRQAVHRIRGLNPASMRNWATVGAADTAPVSWWCSTIPTLICWARI